MDTVVGDPAMAETAMGDQEVRWAAQMVAAAILEAVTAAEWSAAPSLKRVEIPAETLEVLEQARDESTG